MRFPIPREHPAEGRVGNVKERGGGFSAAVFNIDRDNAPDDVPRGSGTFVQRVAGNTNRRSNRLSIA